MSDIWTCKVLDYIFKQNTFNLFNAVACETSDVIDNTASVNVATSRCSDTIDNTVITTDGHDGSAVIVCLTQPTVKRFVFFKLKNICIRIVCVSCLFY